MATVNEKSGSEVAQNFERARTKGRDLDFWKSRVFRRKFVHDGKTKEVQDWSVRIQHAGHREFFNLDTPNKVTAAARAKERFEFVKAHGWETALAKFKHGEEKAKIAAEKAALTVGEYIAEVEKLATDHRPRTIHDYGKCLRLLLSEVLEAEGVKVTREKVDAIRLEEITAARLERWKAARIQPVRGKPQAEKTAKTTANTVIRQARALFGRKIVPVLRDAGVNLPAVLPFAGVNLFSEDTSSKFKRKVDPAKLIAAAVEKLDAPQGAGEDEKTFAARRQCFLAFVLAFAAGLRKSEADFLEWDSVDFEKGELRVETTDYFKPKTEASAAPVTLDPETVAILRGFRAKYPKDRFVLRSKLKPRTATTYSFYRAEPTWKALQSWLVAQGVKDAKPIHYCRKAITDHMANEFGIFAAQRHARHTTPQVTARYYSDGKSVAPGVGAFFTAKAEEAEKVVEGEFTAKEPAKKTGRKKGATR
jgi:integrase